MLFAFNTSRLIHIRRIVLEGEKLLRFIVTKTDNRFVNSLDLGYVLHHCNAEKFLLYLSDVNKCVHLGEDRI